MVSEGVLQFRVVAAIFFAPGPGIGVLVGKGRASVAIGSFRTAANLP